MVLVVALVLDVGGGAVAVVHAHAVQEVDPVVRGGAWEAKKKKERKFETLEEIEVVANSGRSKGYIISPKFVPFHLSKFWSTAGFSTGNKLRFYLMSSLLFWGLGIAVIYFFL